MHRKGLLPMVGQLEQERDSRSRWGWIAMMSTLLLIGALEGSGQVDEMATSNELVEIAIIGFDVAGGTEPELANTVTSDVESWVIKSGKHRVAIREDIDKAMEKAAKEMGLSFSDLMSPSEGLELGNWFSARYLLVGRITKQAHRHYHITVRKLAVEAGQVVGSETGVVEVRRGSNLTSQEQVSYRAQVIASALLDVPLPPKPVRSRGGIWDWVRRWFPRLVVTLAVIVLLGVAYLVYRIWGFLRYVQVYVHVMDQGSNQGVGGVAIALSTPQGQRLDSGRTNAEGMVLFRFLRTRLRQGSVDVVLRPTKQGWLFSPESARIAVSLEKLSEAGHRKTPLAKFEAISLANQALIQGRVTKSGSGALPEISIAISRENTGEELGQAKTNADGYYGARVVIQTPTGHAREPMQVVVKPEATSGEVIPESVVVTIRVGKTTECNFTFVGDLQNDFINIESGTLHAGYHPSPTTDAALAGMVSNLPLPDESGVFSHGRLVDYANHCYPPAKVHVRGFRITRYPVTVREYREFTNESSYPKPPNWLNGEPPLEILDLPVTYVRYEDAVAYCEWLSEQQGRPVRLPTHLEWQRAARGNDTRLFPWGDEFRSDHLNSAESERPGPVPVTQFSGAVSPFGVMDMAGNVCEWVDSGMERTEGAIHLHFKAVCGSSFGSSGKLYGIVFVMHQLLLTKAEGLRTNQQAQIVPPQPWIGFRVAQDAIGTESGPPKLPRQTLIELDGEPEGFCMARLAVSNSEYAEFVVQTNHTPPNRWESVDWARKSPQASWPVVWVSQQDAQAFCRWKTNTDPSGRHYGLPTVAQWERAAHGPQRMGQGPHLRDYPWGNSYSPYLCNSRDSLWGRLLPVDSIPEGQSPEGFLNMTGNCYEWLSEPGVTRGGSYMSDCRKNGKVTFTTRNRQQADGDTGFRYVATVPTRPEGVLDQDLVRLTSEGKEIWISRYPVTNREYAEFARESGHQAPGYWASERWPLCLPQADWPVVTVSQRNAKAFCKWKGNRDPGRVYGLPSAEIWERAYSSMPEHNAMGMVGAVTQEPGPPVLLRVYSCPEGVALDGVHQLIGNVLQWLDEPGLRRGTSYRSTTNHQTSGEDFMDAETGFRYIATHGGTSGE